jgi:hypothetical protein
MSVKDLGVKIASSLGAIRTIDPYLCNVVSIAHGHLPENQWYAYQRLETAASLGPGKWDRG